MSSTKISFNEVEVKIQNKKKNIKSWILEVSKEHSHAIESLSYTFGNDAFLLKINQSYLNHDTLTDIITFDLRDETNNKKIEGDIYISIERIKENAKIHNASYKEEELRVIIHGLLHLCGFKDKKDTDKRNMRVLEENAIAKFNAMFHVE